MFGPINDQRSGPTRGLDFPKLSTGHSRTPSSKTSASDAAVRSQAVPACSPSCPATVRSRKDPRPATGTRLTASLTRTISKRLRVLAVPFLGQVSVYSSSTGVFLMGSTQFASHSCGSCPPAAGLWPLLPPRRTFALGPVPAVAGASAALWGGGTERPGTDGAKSGMDQNRLNTDVWFESKPNSKTCLENSTWILMVSLRRSRVKFCVQQNMSYHFITWLHAT